MPDERSHVQKHHGKYASALGGGSLLAVVLVLIETGAFDRFKSEPHTMADLPERIIAIETELPHKAPKDQVARLETLVEQQAIHINNLTLQNQTTSSQFETLIQVLREQNDGP